MEELYFAVFVILLIIVLSSPALIDVLIDHITAIKKHNAEAREYMDNFDKYGF